ncbi:MAG: hypothetical protein HYW48_02595 [Deltaproteobacteria bacterium]|nr:hypothetical protein [Deltaproteobacteria bacterium]
MASLKTENGVSFSLEAAMKDPGMSGSIGFTCEFDNGMVKLSFPVEIWFYLEDLEAFVLQSAAHPFDVRKLQLKPFSDLKVEFKNAEDASHIVVSLIFVNYNYETELRTKFETDIASLSLFAKELEAEAYRFLQG